MTPRAGVPGDRDNRIKKPPSSSPLRKRSRGQVRLAREGRERGAGVDRSNEILIQYYFPTAINPESITGIDLVKEGEALCLGVGCTTIRFLG